MDLVNRWRELREKKGLTQEELGELIGLSKQMISAIENGTPTTTDRIAKACRALGCQPGDLYQMTEETSEAAQV